TGSPVLAESGFEITKGKVTVDGDMRVPGEDNIFILGDCAWVMDEEAGKPFPATAQAAIQDADTCANNIVALIKGGPMEKLQFDDKGTVASLRVTDGIGTMLNGKELKWKREVEMKTDIKKVIDKRSLLILGVMKIILKKGKVRPF